MHAHNEPLPADSQLAHMIGIYLFLVWQQLDNGCISAAVKTAKTNRKSTVPFLLSKLN